MLLIGLWEFGNGSGSGQFGRGLWRRRERRGVISRGGLGAGRGVRRGYFFSALLSVAMRERMSSARRLSGTSFRSRS